MRAFTRGIDESVVDRTRPRVGSVREEPPALADLLYQASCSLANGADCETPFWELSKSIEAATYFQHPCYAEPCLPLALLLS